MALLKYIQIVLLMDYKDQLSDNGFAIIENIYDATELTAISTLINQSSSDKETFRKSGDLFAIRQFVKEIPGTTNILLNYKLRTILSNLFSRSYFITKSIYFDKPENSNWYVSYHQDLTISVDEKADTPGFINWTKKQNQFAVQPPINILENNITVRIHLDNTDENNGALKVIPQSHLKGIYRPETIDWSEEKEISCSVPSGGVMLMKPLLLHSSGRTTNQKQRRVIHIEFSDHELPASLNWSERISLS